MIALLMGSEMATERLWSPWRSVLAQTGTYQDWKVWLLS